MRRLAVVALTAFLGMVLATSAAWAGHESLSVLIPGDPLEGSRLFSGKGCLGCHAVHGVGGTTGPDLGRGGLNRPLLEIAAVMWNHAPGMERVFEEKRVVRPTFKPGEMASLLAFLYYLGSLNPPGDADAGARLFAEKRCVQCHSLGGVGGKVGPALDVAARRADVRQDVRDVVALERGPRDVMGLHGVRHGPAPLPERRGEEER